MIFRSYFSFISFFLGLKKDLVGGVIIMIDCVAEIPTNSCQERELRTTHGRVIVKEMAHAYVSVRRYVHGIKYVSWSNCTTHGTTDAFISCLGRNVFFFLRGRSRSLPRLPLVKSDTFKLKSQESNVKP